MLKIIAVAALSVGMATSAMAAGGAGPHLGNFTDSTNPTTMRDNSLDTTTTGSVNGTVNSNSANTRSPSNGKLQNCRASMKGTSTGSASTYTGACQ